MSQTKAIQAAAISLGVYYYLKKVNPDLLWSDGNELRFGPFTLELISVAVGGLAYYKGIDLVTGLVGGKSDTSFNAGAMDFDVQGANLGQTFRGMAGVAGDISIGSTFE